MPGLIRGVARTAVVAGTATAVSNRVSRRQGARWSNQQQQADEQQQQQEYEAQQQAAAQQAAAQQAATPAAGGVDRLTALKQLGELKTSGVLTEAEFEAEKARILQS